MLSRLDPRDWHSVDRTSAVVDNDLKGSGAKLERRRTRREGEMPGFAVCGTERSRRPAPSRFGNPSARFVGLKQGGGTGDTGHHREALQAGA